MDLCRQILKTCSDCVVPGATLEVMQTGRQGSCFEANSETRAPFLHMENQVGLPGRDDKFLKVLCIFVEPLKSSPSPSVDCFGPANRRFFLRKPALY